MNITVTRNLEKNGIELRFDEKPDIATRAALKDAGFRWSTRQQLWYAKSTLKSETLASEVTEGEGIPATKYDLWALTRTDSIGKNPKLSAKDTAAAVRKHLRARFPMCKFSVTSTQHSVDTLLVSSPFAPESPEYSAIVEYAYAYVDSYNTYDPQDLRRGFCNLCARKADWRYTQTDEDVQQISRDFAEAMEADAERREAEIAEAMRRYEAEQAEQERQMAITEANVRDIESNAVCSDVCYFLGGLDETAIAKLSSVDEYMKEQPARRVKCKVTREVRLDCEHYDMFSNLLLQDFSFLDRMGGSETAQDIGFEDYLRMSSAERDEVEWYSTKCVAIFCNDELKLVVDPQGFSYARYVFFPTPDTFRLEEAA